MPNDNADTCFSRRYAQPLVLTCILRNSRNTEAVTAMLPMERKDCTKMPYL